MISPNFQSDALISLVGVSCVVSDMQIIAPEGIERPSDEAISAEAVRLEAAYHLSVLRDDRNRLLSETDYLALSDATLTDDMKTYRQALRDLPANTTDPANPVWPTKPGE